MAEMYNHHTVEKKWQKVWDDEKAFHTPNEYTKPKFYALVEFPYPSGQGLHVGHPRPYTALDIVARKRRMQGYNVLYPLCNRTIQNKLHPMTPVKHKCQNGGRTRGYMQIRFHILWRGKRKPG